MDTMFDDGGGGAMDDDIENPGYGGPQDSPGEQSFLNISRDDDEEEEDQELPTLPPQTSSPLTRKVQAKKAPASAKGKAKADPPSEEEDPEDVPEVDPEQDDVDETPRPKAKKAKTAAPPKEQQKVIRERLKKKENREGLCSYFFCPTNMKSIF